MKAIIDILIPILKESGLEEGLRLNILKSKWSEIFREPLSLHMYPVSLKSGDLLIDVDSPAWLQELTIRREQILESLKGFGLNNIRFRLGRIKKTCRGISHNTPASDKSTDSPQLMRYLDEVTSIIKNDELKEAIKRAMRKSLSEIKSKQNHLKED